MKIRPNPILPLALVLIGLLYGHAFSQRVEKYSVFFGRCTIFNDSGAYVALRSFCRAGNQYYFVVSARDLYTRIVARDSCRCDRASLGEMRREFQAYPYIMALDSAERRSSLVQDAGLTHGSVRQKGIDLTADLCPSKLPLDRKFFADLIDQFLPQEKPIPIALSVTGNWMNDHQEDLRWLIGLAKKGDLAITWINHSYNHRWYDSVPVQENFLLKKGTNLDLEVLKTERKMMDYGITPSVFFRFPGLVSDSLVFAKITAYGLIPVGTDAWLAKNQLPKDGSIVLVHANGNEPYGIKRFFKLIREYRDSISAGKWLLYDLRESIASGKSR
jgi:hypothetical protein